MNEVTQVLNAIAKGDTIAGERLLPLAAYQMASARGRHHMQAKALHKVHFPDVLSDRFAHQ